MALSQPWNTHCCLPFSVYCSALYVLLWGIKHAAIKVISAASIQLSTGHSCSLNHSVPNSNPPGLPKSDPITQEQSIALVSCYVRPQAIRTLPIYDCIWIIHRSTKQWQVTFKKPRNALTITAAQWRQVIIVMQFSLPRHSAPHTSDLLEASHFTRWEKQRGRTRRQQNQLFFS